MPDRTPHTLGPPCDPSLLHKQGGDVNAVATQAGIERESVYRLLRQYGLSAGPFREPGDKPPPSRRRREEPDEEQGEE